MNLSDGLTILVPSLVALIGTAVTVWLAFRQQRVQQRHERQSSIQQDRVAAYKGLWATLEEVHLLMRTDKAALQKYNQCMTTINEYLMKNDLYLDDEDRALSRRYVVALKKVTELVEKYADEIPQLKAGWAITAPLIPKKIAQFQEEETALITTLNDVREQILIKCRRIIGV
ncbi:MAG: hypothetical protein ACOYL5_07155 [Phototrophicaceae bacterium]